MKAKQSRWVALASLGFIVPAVLGRLLYPSEPEFLADAGSIVSFYEAAVDDLLAANTVYLVGTAFLLWFAAALAAALRRVEGEDGIASRTAFAGAIAGVSMMIAGSSTDLVAALRVDERGAIDPQVAAVMWDLNNVLFGLGAPTAFGVLVLAVASVALRGLALPKWHGAVSVVLGVALLVPPISWLAMLVFLFWVPATGAALALYEGQPVRAPRAAAATS